MLGILCTRGYVVTIIPFIVIKLSLVALLVFIGDLPCLGEIETDARRDFL